MKINFMNLDRGKNFLSLGKKLHHLSKYFKNYGHSKLGFPFLETHGMYVLIIMFQLMFPFYLGNAVDTLVY